ncbi:hypothetical protein ADK43_08995 [Streptomyces rimosus subsp. rimosus]|nr:hypothetical protein ADK43_08995 [Streptomyces rimosus subsp. rimosus]
MRSPARWRTESTTRAESSAWWPRVTASSGAPSWACARARSVRAIAFRLGERDALGADSYVRRACSACWRASSARPRQTKAVAG